MLIYILIFIGFILSGCASVSPINPRHEDSPQEVKAFPKESLSYADWPLLRDDKINLTELKRADRFSVYLHDKNNLTLCGDEYLGIKILCNPNWEIEKGEGVIKFFISRTPKESLTISRVKSPLKLTGQLDKEKVSELGAYPSNFKYEYAPLASQQAVKVDAVSSNSLREHRQDYYIVYDQFLYMLYFSIVSDEAWEKDKFMIKEMVKSFRFTE